MIDEVNKIQQYRYQKCMRNPRSYLVKKHYGMMERVTDRHNKYYYGLDCICREDFLEFALNDPAFNKLWIDYQAHGRPRKLAPSIDRIDSSQGYILGNIQFLTQSENARKANVTKRRYIGTIARDV